MAISLLVDMPQIGDKVKISSENMCDVGIVDGIFDGFFSIKPVCQEDEGKHFFGLIVSLDFITGEWRATLGQVAEIVKVEIVSGDD